MNILGYELLKKYLEEILSNVFCIFKQIWIKIVAFKHLEIFITNIKVKNKSGFNGFILNQNFVYF
jgi:hypothetical protein